MHAPKTLYTGAPKMFLALVFDIFGVCEKKHHRTSSPPLMRFRGHVIFAFLFAIETQPKHKFGSDFYSSACNIEREKPGRAPWPPLAMSH